MKQLRMLLLLAALPLMTVLVLTGLYAQGTATLPPATPTCPAVTPAPATPTSMVSSRTTTVGNREVGEVLVGTQVAMRFTETVGGFTPAQRAEIVAGRLNSALGQGYTWQDLRIAQQGTQYTLVMGNDLITTVDPRDARAAGSTPMNLAMTWQEGTRNMLQQTAVARTDTPTTLVAGSQEVFPAWTNPATRIVPIVAVGTPGVRIGAAQVTGPSDRVDDVSAVLQLDVEFRSFARARVFVPSTSLTSLNRVQGVAVSALLQYGLFQF